MSRHACTESSGGPGRHTFTHTTAAPRSRPPKHRKPPTHPFQPSASSRSWQSVHSCSSGASAGSGCRHAGSGSEAQQKWQRPWHSMRRPSHCSTVILLRLSSTWRCHGSPRGRPYGAVEQGMQARGAVGRAAGHNASHAMHLICFRLSALQTK